MKGLATFVTPMFATLAAVGLLATSASAATTTIRRDTATGAPYAGSIRFTNLGNLTFSGTASGIPVTATCTNAVLGGTITSDASSGTLEQATIDGCSSSSAGGSAEITFLDLPYTEGSGAYDPVTGGRDGWLRFTDPRLKVKVVINLLGTHTCYYGFGGTVTSLTFDLYNRDNDNRPNPADDAQGEMKDASLDLLPGSSSMCPADGKANGIGSIRGETTAGSGTFDQKLYATS